jgi:hypothetical protein
MQKSLFEGNGITSLLIVDGEEDLKPKGGININPPPADGRCDGCGRYLSELKPFGKAGDPLVGDFDGALLLKNFRPDAPHNEVVERIYDEFFGNCPTEEDFQKAKENLAQKYGEKQAEYIINWVEISGSVGSSWECRDCIVLDDYEFEDMVAARFDTPEKCDCCGKPLADLKPFTEGDPVMGYFIGKLLARRERPSVPPTDEFSKMMDEFFGNCITLDDNDEALGKLIQKYGREEALKLWTFTFFLDGSFQSNWECKDCIALDTHQYFVEKMAQEPDSDHNSPG